MADDTSSIHSGVVISPFKNYWDEQAWIAAGKPSIATWEQGEASKATEKQASDWANSSDRANQILNEWQTDPGWRSVSSTPPNLSDMGMSGWQITSDGKGGWQVTKAVDSTGTATTTQAYTPATDYTVPATTSTSAVTTPTANAPTLPTGTNAAAATSAITPTYGGATTYSKKSKSPFAASGAWPITNKKYPYKSSLFKTQASELL